jgi:hypothetical protein
MYFDQLEGAQVNCAVAVNDMVYFAGVFTGLGEISANSIIGCNLSGVCIDALEGGLPNRWVAQMVCILVEI